MAQTVEELSVYRKALAAARALYDLLHKPGLREDLELKRLLDKGTVRVVSDIAEGFEQRTDRGFAKYLFDARGSARELCAQLDIASARHSAIADACAENRQRYDEIARMLTGLIGHLQREDRKDRHMVKRRKSNPTKCGDS